MSSNANPDDTWTAFALTVFKVNGLLMQAGEGITRPLGQSSARWQVLGRAHQPRTIAQIAREVGYARQSIQRVADVLESEGLVAYREHPKDRRTKLVVLTTSGRRVLMDIYARQVEWSRDIMSQLDTEQLASLSTALDDVRRVLEGNLHP